MLIPQVKLQDRRSARHATVWKAYFVSGSGKLQTQQAIFSLTEGEHASRPAHGSIDQANEGAHPHRPPISAIPATINKVPNHWAGEIDSWKSRLAAIT